MRLLGVKLKLIGFSLSVVCVKRCLDQPPNAFSEDVSFEQARISAADSKSWPHFQAD